LGTFALVSATLLAEDPGYFPPLARTVALGAGLATAAAVLQFHGLAFTGLCHAKVGPCGLLGNPNLLATFLFLSLPFIIFLINGRLATDRWLAWASLAIVAYGLWLAQSRTGLIVGVMLGGVGLARQVWGRLRPPVRLGGAVALALGLGALGWWTGLLGQAWASFAQGDPLTNSLAERRFMWANSLEMWAKNPLAGLGAGQWRVAFPAYGTDGSLMADGTLVFQNPHNDWLWITAELGTVGVVAWLGLWAAFGWLGWRHRQAPESFTVGLLALAYLLDSLVNFPGERAESLLLLALGLGTALAWELRRANASPTLVANQGKGIWVVALALALGGWVAWLANRAASDRRLAVAKAELATDPSRALEYLDRTKAWALTLDGLTNPVALYRSSAHLALGNPAQALAEAERGLAQNPYHSGTLVQVAYCLRALNRLPEAQQYYEKALAYAPGSPNALVGLVVVLYQQGQVEKARQLYRRADPYHPVIKESVPQLEKVLGVRPGQ
jgi:tetratricopeptide (TPR) repeat protein